MGFVSQFTYVMLEVVEKVSKTLTRDEIIIFIIIRVFWEEKNSFLLEQSLTQLPIVVFAASEGEKRTTLGPFPHFQKRYHQRSKPKLKITFQYLLCMLGNKVKNWAKWTKGLVVLSQDIGWWARWPSHWAIYHHSSNMVIRIMMHFCSFEACS